MKRVRSRTLISSQKLHLQRQFRLEKCQTPLGLKYVEIPRKTPRARIFKFDPGSTSRTLYTYGDSKADQNKSEKP